MTQQLFIWFAVVVVMMMAFAFKGLKTLNSTYHFSSKVRRHVRFGSEQEMFYIPGDPIESDRK